MMVMENAATTQLGIEGMTCAACVTRVERALRRVPGVEDATVNLATETAQVRWVDGLGDEVQLRRAVRAAGYAPRETATLPDAGSPWQGFWPVGLGLLLSAPLILPMLGDAFGRLFVPGVKLVNMAHLAIVGSRAVNGVAAMSATSRRGATECRVGAAIDGIGRRIMTSPRAATLILARRIQCGIRLAWPFTSEAGGAFMWNPPRHMPQQCGRRDPMKRSSKRRFPVIPAQFRFSRFLKPGSPPALPILLRRTPGPVGKTAKLLWQQLRLPHSSTLWAMRRSTG